MKIGVLALQGAFQLHKPHLEALGAEYVEVVAPIDLEKIDGLIIPGGESSVMLKLLHTTDMQIPLKEFLNKRPAWGICAGAILMAKTVSNPNQFSFGTMNIGVERNGYGRQLESVQEELEGYLVSYIRAPKISKVGHKLKILAEREGLPTWVESSLSMVTTFHPETNLSFPSPWHRRLVERTARASTAL